MNTQVKKRSLAGTILKTILLILLIVVAAAAALIGYLTATEYYPKAGEQETVPVMHENDSVLTGSGPLRIMTWNVGYGALGDNADFFMDGGSGVNTATKDRVQENVSSMLDVIEREDPDILFLQEVDLNSMRSHHTNEVQLFSDAFSGMESAFAYNFKVPFIPYPIPPIGTVNSGIVTLSSWHQTQVLREALPCPFSWPIRVANLKRCVLISRIPAPDSKELVLVNLHLEAYDSGEGKIAQTKQLRELLETEAGKGNYVIAGGDFNQVFSDTDIAKYPAQEGKWQAGEIDVNEFSSDLSFLMDSNVPTCRSLDQPYEGADKENFQYYVIDGFIVSSNLEVKRLETLDEGFVSTDHNPVLLEVEMAG